MSALKTVLFFVPNLLLWLVAFISITVPTWLFGLASQSLTITMTFTTLLLIVGLFGAAVTWLVRYRVLNVYSRLPPEPQRKEPQIDLVPEVQAGDSKRGLSNYLDEFLEAIKIFGYLERPVFHELTRTMQTKKLLAGETLSMEEEKGFGIVVDGHVQIFVRAQKPDRTQRGTSFPDVQEDSEDDLGERSSQQGYQLLTDVRNGAPMSSLFSILALFTEDIRLRYDEDDHDNPLHTGTSSMSFAMRKHSRSIPHSPYYGNTFVNTSHLRDMRFSKMNDALSPVPPLSLDSRDAPRPSSIGPGPPSLHQRNASANRQTSHPEVVIRACTDTTIAVIPPSAFKRLTRTYPKAAAHIVQVILNKLQRVTLASAHSYLGLAEEVLKTEKEIARLTFYELPNHLRGSALERLRSKFAAERSRLGEEADNHKGIALHNSSLKRNRRTSSNAQRDLLAQLKIKALNAMQQQAPALDSPGFSHSRAGISAGDLITNIQMPRKPRIDVSDSVLDDKRFSEAIVSPSATSPLALMERSPFIESPRKALIRQESLDEDDIFRTSICQCITKAIGLTNPRNGLLNRTADSVEQSPRLVSYDARRYSATFANAFGTIDAFDGSTDGDDDSVASSSLNLSAPNFQQTQTELKDDIEIVYFPAGAVLVEEGERNPGLYYVIDGFLEVSASLKDETETAEININNTLDQNDDPLPKGVKRQAETPGKKRGGHPEHKTASKVLYKIKPGGLAGYIGSISSYRSFVDITAKTDVFVGFLPRASLEKLVDRFPVVLMTMAKRLTTLLPTLIQHIDFALEWIQVNAGEVIYNQGEESDAIYIVLNGRLRALKDKDKSTMRLAGEYGQGDSVGELDVLTESLRPTTLHAIRDTEVARLPKTLFNSLSLEHPGITIRISKIIAQRMRSLLESPLSEQVLEKRAATKSKNAKSTTNLRTVAILPVTSGVPVVEFSNKLLSAFNHVGMANGVTVLNQAGILNHLGRHAFSRMGKLKLSQYLADLEEQYSMLLYVADTNVTSPWTQTCIGQADCILLVALAEDSTEIGEFERFLLGTKSTARKDLVLLHPERYSPPGLTRKWLQNRPWINGGHHHIQMLYHVNPQPISPQSRPIGKSIKQRVQVIQAGIQKYTSRRIRQTPLYSTDTPFKGDFHRLARRLCGKSVGLVLGGGGARGIAHVGIISAFEEAGIPIDLVGGTSIGSFIGALYAKDADVVPMYGRAKKFAGRMGSMWRFALDLTYPSVSYTTGHEFNRGIFKAFGNAQIEDFWLEFYCNTVNISKSRPEIHNSGYAWRYVRASMTLVGLLPPLCDEGDMLLDGGYIDNLTVGHMKSLGADAIFAIDVGALDDDSPQNFGDSLSGLWTIVNRWNPFSSYVNPPTLSEIQARLAYVSSVDALERAKQIHGCLYMRPPVELYGTLDFSKFDEIYQIGYKYGTEYLTKLREKGVLPVTEETEDKKNLRRTMAPRRASI